MAHENQQQRVKGASKKQSSDFLFPKAHTLVKVAQHFQIKWAQYFQILSNSLTIGFH
jgi:hypothetical protein